MDIGIGLPTAIAGVEAATLLAWARDAEARGFDSVSVLDRVVFPNFEPLVTLGAVAAVTERVTLLTGVLLAAARANPAALAKQVATLDRLAGGRLVLGVGAGSREDDFAVGGVDYATRGAALDATLEAALAVWRGESGIGPEPTRPGGPPLLMGGGAPPALRRMARLGQGWIGGGGLENFEAHVPRARQAWADAGREGAPRILATIHFALGAGADEAAQSHVDSYYGSDPARSAAGLRNTRTTTAQVHEAVGAYADAGCEELLFLPCSADPSQVERLADAVGVDPARRRPDPPAGVRASG